MKKMKMAAITGLLVTASLALAACSSGNSSEKGTEEAKTEGPVTINYYGRPDDNGVETAIVTAFEEANPDIKVNYVELPDSSNDRLKTINTVLQAGDSSIDVFAGDVVWPPIFLQQAG